MVVVLAASFFLRTRVVIKLHLFLHLTCSPLGQVALDSFCFLVVFGLAGFCSRVGCLALLFSLRSAIQRAILCGKGKKPFRIDLRISYDKAPW